MVIPNAGLAEIDIRKLRDYCLNQQHADGKHKARLFAAALGMTASDADALRDIIFEAIGINDAQLGRRDAFGQRYTIDFTVTWNDKRALVRTGWIIEHSSSAPRLTTCYPL